jgi:kinesin family protein 11
MLLVDLAGADYDNRNDDAQKDSAAINKSLLTLKECFRSLAQATDQKPPFRDSKLTRILQEALGGKSKTCIIATISPSILAVDESVSTLNYAEQANGIKNKVQESSVKMVGSAMPAGFMAPTSSSGGGGGGGGGGGSLADWNEIECKLAYMEAQVSEAQGALGRKHAAMQVREGSDQEHTCSHIVCA